MGLLSAVGKRGMRALQSGEMFGQWDDLARVAGMSEEDAIRLIQRAQAGEALSNPERQLLREMINYTRGRYDDPALANSRVRAQLQGGGPAPMGGPLTPPGTY
jgi:hypothetical protein